jgi:predicted nucleotidyltransferase
MNEHEIKSALREIAAETDVTVKHLKLASLCSTLFAERGVELVVVGGSAIEFYTEGAYTSGDVDLCVLSSREPLTVRLRQEIMGRLSAKGGPRSWEVGDAYIDILGSFENLARTAVRTIRAPFGNVKVSPVEELIVERVLVSRYPQDYPPALDCAKKILAAVLEGEVEVDWNEVKRLANANAYSNWADVKALTNEQAKALQIRSPYDSDE